MTDLAFTDPREQRRSSATASSHAFERLAAPKAAEQAAATPRAEWRALAQLRNLGDAWRELARRALEPNVFYEPAFAFAAARVFGEGVGAVLVWSGDGTGAHLIGFFPARIDRGRYGRLLPVLAGWTHPFAPLGLPLVDRARAHDAIAAWLDCVERLPDLPKLVLLPMLPAESAFATALRDALAQRRRGMRAVALHRRALLAPGKGNRSGYITAALPNKKRKELARQRRRLAEDGAVDFTIASRPAELPSALADFLALEAAGWKGRARTAAAQDAALNAFIAEATRNLGDDGQIEIARLTLSGRPLAAAILLRGGSTAWFWKIAYDESAARASPGVQIALDLTNALLADPSVIAVDSCAVENHPMIDRLWRERLALADHVIALGPSAPYLLPFAHALECARSAAMAAAKWARRRLRGR
jgi:CelD/BcsL family acetyltransferase involved in cellulose biosynthesis